MLINSTSLSRGTIYSSTPSTPLGGFASSSNVQLPGPSTSAAHPMATRNSSHRKAIIGVVVVGLLAIVAIFNVS